MKKIRQYDTVVLREPVGAFQKGEKGAVIEMYTTPYEAYDIEIVTDEGETKGLLEGVYPQQVERLPLPDEHVRFADIRIEDGGVRAAVHFSDGTQIVVHAEELYERVR